MKKFSKDYQPENRRKPDKLTPILKEWLNKPFAPDCTIGEKIVEVLINEAINGNLKAAQFIFERVDGKLTQSIEVEQTNFAPPKIIYLPADTSKPPVTDESQIIDPLEPPK